MKGPDGPSCDSTASTGVSVAYNTVFVACDSMSGTGVSTPFVGVVGGVFAYSLHG